MLEQISAYNNLTGNACTAETVKKIGNEQKGIVVFFNNWVQSSEVNAKAEQIVFFANKEDWSHI